MTGQLALFIRYLLYPVAGALVAKGIIPEASTEAFVINIAEVAAGAVIYFGTVAWSSFARNKGGAT